MQSRPDNPTPQPRAAAVLFDLDGTLTLPYFDYDAIRREIGLPTNPRTPILEAVERMMPADRARAEVIVLRHEEEAALASELQPDAHTVLNAIRGSRIPLGLITRNSRTSVDTVIAKHSLHFDCIHTREDGPIKPSPDPVLAVCRKFGVSPRSAWFVGDYLFDLQCGNSAGATTVLMIGDDPLPPFADQATHVIRRLSELLPLLDIDGERRAT